MQGEAWYWGGCWGAETERGGHGRGSCGCTIAGVAQIGELLAVLADNGRRWLWRWSTVSSP